MSFLTLIPSGFSPGGDIGEWRLRVSFPFFFFFWLRYGLWYIDIVTAQRSNMRLRLGWEEPG